VPTSNFAHAGITRSHPLVVPDGYHLVERRTLLGSGHRVHDRALRTISRWGTKTRAGFRVRPSVDRVREGAYFLVTIGLGPFSIREPVQVSWVDAAGFGYGTLAGHPLSGEEAFLVEQDDADLVWFVNRSVSRPASRGWQLLSPFLSLAQGYFVRRYGRVMRRASRPPRR